MCFSKPGGVKLQSFPELPPTSTSSKRTLRSRDSLSAAGSGGAGSESPRKKQRMALSERRSTFGGNMNNSNFSRSNNSKNIKNLRPATARPPTSGGPASASKGSGRKMNHSLSARRLPNKAPSSELKERERVVLGERPASAVAASGSRSGSGGLSFLERMSRPKSARVVQRRVDRQPADPKTQRREVCGNQSP